MLVLLFGEVGRDDVPHRLSIWIVIILVLSWECPIFCPPIERSAAVASVKMDGRGPVIFVDESHNSLSTFGHMERGAWSNSIVPDVRGCSKIWVSLLVKWDDVDFKVVNRCPGRWIRVACDGLRDGRNRQRKLKYVLIPC